MGRDGGPSGQSAQSTEQQDSKSKSDHGSSDKPGIGAKIKSAIHKS